jgi:SAM-dependent methyltransferase
VSNITARSFAIRESGRRVLNAFSEDKVASLGRALRLTSGTQLLDLACGKGEMLCMWARDHQVRGVGVDQSSFFLDDARSRAAELGVSDRVNFVQADAATYTSAQPVDVVSCLGASWIAGGVDGIVTRLRSSLRPGGVMLLGEPYWRRPPDSTDVLAACHALNATSYGSLAGLVAQLAALGCDIVGMALADQDDWDEYASARWLSVRRWLDSHPQDELAAEFRQELFDGPLEYVRYQREYLGWGVFVLTDR